MNMPVPSVASLPHEREIIGLCELAMAAYKDETRDYLGLAITDTEQHARYLLQKLRDAVVWDAPRVHIHRGGIEIKGGGRIIVTSSSNPSVLIGLRPTEIILFGNLGEMYYWLLSMNVPIKGIA